MFVRWVEGGLLDLLEENGVGCIPFSPLAQGLLTDKYLKGIPKNSRAAKPHGFLKAGEVTPEKIEKMKKIERNREKKKSVARSNGAFMVAPRFTHHHSVDRREFC